MPERCTSPIPAVSGSPGLAQGSYGERGNLELVAPDAGDGFWVFWFNADADDHRRGALPGRWSGGLHVFAGHRVVATRITQVRRGPDYLEALALDDAGDLHRLYWTPADGFVAAGVIASRVLDCAPVVEHDAHLTIDVVTDDGRARRLHGDADDYPRVSWVSSVVADEPVAWSRADPATGLHLDDGGRILNSEEDLVADLGAHALAVTRTTIDGGRLDVVAAVGAGLVHVTGSPPQWDEPQPVVSDVWVEPGAPVHRR